MNDDEKIFSVSEMFYQEIERWSDVTERDFSEEEKLNEIYRLQSVITGAKEILDRPRESDDE